MAEGPGAPAKKVLRHVTFSCRCVALAYFKEKTLSLERRLERHRPKEILLASFSLLTYSFLLRLLFDAFYDFSFDVNTVGGF